MTAALARDASIVALNLASMLASAEAPLAAGLPAFARGLWHHVRGRYGDGGAPSGREAGPAGAATLVVGRGGTRAALAATEHGGTLAARAAPPTRQRVALAARLPPTPEYSAVPLYKEAPHQVGDQLSRAIETG